MGGASWVADFQDIISVIVSLMGFFSFLFFFFLLLRAGQPLQQHTSASRAQIGEIRPRMRTAQLPGFSVQLLSRPLSADSEGLGFNADLTGVFV